MCNGLECTCGGNCTCGDNIENEKYESMLTSDIKYVYGLFHDDGDGHGCNVVLRMTQLENKKAYYRTTSIRNMEEEIDKALEYNRDLLVIADLPLTLFQYEKIMEKMEHGKIKKFIYIDHHLGNPLKGKPNCIVNEDLAACEIMYDNFKGYIPSGYRTKVKKLVDKLGTYDIFRFKTKKYSEEYINEMLKMQIFVNTHRYDSPSVLVERISNNEDVLQNKDNCYIEPAFKDVEYAINKLKDRAIPISMKAIPSHIPVYMTYHDSLANIKIYGYTNNEVITRLGGNLILVVFKVDTGECTLVTDREDIDISSICKRFGGGGHRKVGGFRVTGWDNPLTSNIKNLLETF